MNSHLHASQLKLKVPLVDEPLLSMKSGLVTLDFLAIAGYLVLTFGIALWFSYRQKNTEDFFVGGRTMPWFAVGISILATLFSTLTYQGLPGETIKNGIGVFLGHCAAPFSMVVVLWLWVPFFMRLRLTSAYEYLEHRFNYSVRLIGAVLFILLRLGWMSMVIFAASLALDQVKGPDLEFLPGADLYWWICLIGIVAAVYTALGGIEAMIWVDVLQCLLLLAGVFLTIGVVVFTDHTGPADWWQIAATQSQRNNFPPIFSWDLTVRVTFLNAVIGNFFWTICTHGSDQVVLQRYFSTSSLKSARKSYLVNLCVDLSMSILLALCGMAILAFYLKHPELTPEGKAAGSVAEKLFPHFLGHQLPPGFAGLIISAFLCDAIQTLESGANAITAVVAKDIVPRLLRNRSAQWDDLTLARILSIVITILVTTNAYFVAEQSQSLAETLVGLMPKFFNMFVGPLASLFMIGMFLPRCTAKSAIPAVLTGVTVSVLWSWGVDIIQWVAGPNSISDSVRPTFLLAIAAPCMSSLTMAVLLSRIVETGGDHPGLKWTWRSVTSQPENAQLTGNK